jgi:hypothetical protein
VVTVNFGNYIFVLSIEKNFEYLSTTVLSHVNNYTDSDHVLSLVILYMFMAVVDSLLQYESRMTRQS